MAKKFYITTPIYYPSGDLHLGHVYSTVSADTLKRIKQQQGYDVLFLTGTDEHGEKIQEKAESLNIEPQVYVDQMADKIQDLWHLMDVQYDIFSRTTNMFHVKQVQKYFKQLQDNGDIYLGNYEGLYCVSCETYVTNSQAVDGKCCPDCGKELKTVTEETYMFKCSKYADRVKEMLENDEILIEPASRKNELINSFFANGIPDLAISRTNFKWGIPVPGGDNHVIYVWLDALTNYITMLEERSDMDYWPADVQLLGKEIIRFHAIYWPMILLALGLPMPKKLFAHGWLLMDGEKMSKSKKNVIYPQFLVENYGLDAVRYFLLREIPFGNDGVFTPKAFVQRFNADLANELGNLVSRSISMANKYFGGQVTDKGVNDQNISDLNEAYDKLVVSRETFIDNLEFSKDLEAIWNFIHLTNKFIDLTTPWVLAKEESEQDHLNTVLYTLLLNVKRIGHLVYPYMPQSGSYIDENMVLDNNAISVPADPKILFSRLDEEVEVERIYDNMK